MTFQTPTEAEAYYAGMSVAAYEDHIDALTRFREEFGEADKEPEDRTNVDYWDVSSDADWEGLQTALDWEAAHPEYMRHPNGYGE